MIVETGHFALVLALALALAQAIVPFAGARLRDASLMRVARARGASRNSCSSPSPMAR